MATKPAIPGIPAEVPPPIKRILGPLKEALETIMGRRNSGVDTLPSSATTAQIIAKINELIALLQ